MKIEWLDAGRWPKNPPDPTYPDGIDLDLRSSKTEVACTTPLPYPAKRCGAYVIDCETCGQHIVVTTAGRKDDPRSVAIPCHLVKPGH